MYLFLIRHGETDWNLEERMQGQTDKPLNARGIEQAAQLAARLAAEENIDTIYTSPLSRARVTAEAIGSRLGVAPIIDSRLAERSAGALEGMTLAEIQVNYPQVVRAWREENVRVLLPGGENQEELHSRVVGFLRMLRSQHAEKRVAVVSHGGTLSMLLASILDMDINKRFPFRLDNASVSQIDLERPRPRIDLLNDTCHLRATVALWHARHHPAPSRDETAVATSLESD